MIEIINNEIEYLHKKHNRISENLKKRDIKDNLYYEYVGVQRQILSQINFLYILLALLK